LLLALTLYLHLILSLSSGTLNKKAFRCFFDGKKMKRSEMFCHVATSWSPTEGSICEANVLDGVKGIPLASGMWISTYIACVYTAIPFGERGTRLLCYKSVFVSLQFQVRNSNVPKQLSIVEWWFITRWYIIIAKIIYPYGYVQVSEQV